MLQPIESPQCISGILLHDLLGFEPGDSWSFLLCFGYQRGREAGYHFVLGFLAVWDGGVIKFVEPSF